MTTKEVLRVYNIRMKWKAVMIACIWIGAGIASIFNPGQSAQDIIALAMIGTLIVVIFT